MGFGGPQILKFKGNVNYALPSPNWSGGLCSSNQGAYMAFSMFEVLTVYYMNLNIKDGPMCAHLIEDFTSYHGSIGFFIRGEVILKNVKLYGDDPRGNAGIYTTFNSQTKFTLMNSLISNFTVGFAEAW